MSPNQKVEMVRTQVLMAADGRIEEFHCPYCEAISVVGEGPLCCVNMAKVVDATLTDLETQEVQRLVDRIEENADKHKPLVALN